MVSRFRVGLGAVLVVALAADGDRTIAEQPFSVTARPALFDDETAERQSVGRRDRRLTWLGGVELVSSANRFGGWSGLALSADGGQLLAVSDAGAWMAASVNRTEAGGIAGLTDPVMGQLADRQGRPLADKSSADAESLVVLETTDAGWDRGRLLVGFEQGNHRIWRYDPDPAGRVPTLAGPAVDIPAPEALRGRAANGGLEALTILTDGTLLAIAEDVDGPDGTKLGWLGPSDLWTPGRSASRHDWAVFHYRPTAADFRPVDAAIVPEGGPWAGRVLVLERFYSPLAGVAIRLAALEPSSIARGTTVTGTLLGELRSPWPTDNYEGLAVHRDQAGRTILTLISDDNFNRLLQRTLLAALLLDESM